MESYISVKLVEAEPMNLGDYNKARGWKLPEDEDPLKQGYFLQYPDGYRSWCPAEIFNKSYLRVDNNKDLKTDRPSISQKMVDDFIDTIKVLEDGPKTTVVKATLKNGFVRVGYSSCVSPENYDSEIGRKICIDEIKDDIWSNLGFLLQTAVHGVR